MERFGGLQWGEQARIICAAARIQEKAIRYLMRFKVSPPDIVLPLRLPPESQTARLLPIPADWIGVLNPKMSFALQSVGRARFRVSMSEGAVHLNVTGERIGGAP